MKKLLVMAGGTGGHVFPGLAVAKRLQDEGWQIRWLGTADRMEAQLVPQHGIEIDFIEVKGLVGRSLMSKLLAPFMIIQAIGQAWKHIKRYQPDVVLGMGGYVSGPGGLAAWLQGVPVVLHEQNAVAGLTNKLLAKIAVQVLQAFPGAFVDAKVVGNPVRQDLIDLALKTGSNKIDQSPLNILILGGSQGARILNEVLPETVMLIHPPCQVWHQVGKNGVVSTTQLYQQQIAKQLISNKHKELDLSLAFCDSIPQLYLEQDPCQQDLSEQIEQPLQLKNVYLSAFIDDMAKAYQWADLVICRSGALTVSELAAVGLPAIFIPFQHKDRQQALNGDYLVHANAAKMIEQSQLTSELLAKTVNSLSHDEIEQMAMNAKRKGILNAAEQVSDVIKKVSH